MKVTLEFDTRLQALRALKADDAYIALFSFAEDLRRFSKYSQDVVELTVGQDIQRIFFDTLEKYDINLEDLD